MRMPEGGVLSVVPRMRVKGADRVFSSMRMFDTLRLCRRARKLINGA